MKKHDERCKDCKKTLFRLLQRSFGEVKERYSMEMPARLELLHGKWGFEALALIYKKLQDFRGYQEFIKVLKLPAVDYFLPGQGIIVEFDESQHFTLPRLITLSNYPNGLKLGFDRQKWIKIANQLNKRDNDPPYRDEQRAWYDTLRDFVPMILGYKTIVRLCAGDQIWCQLDPDDPVAVKSFQHQYFGKFLY